MTTLICTHSDAMDGPALRVSMAHMPFRKEIQSPTTASPESEPAFRVLRKFRRVFNTVRGHFQQVEKKVGVGGAQVWALGVIYKQPGIGVNALAAAIFSILSSPASASSVRWPTSVMLMTWVSA